MKFKPESSLPGGGLDMKYIHGDCSVHGKDIPFVQKGEGKPFCPSCREAETLLSSSSAQRSSRKPAFSGKDLASGAGVEARTDKI
jgi:hypothetical protein